eukprot:97896_1
MMFDRVEDEEERMSVLTNFMTWASLTRDIEMQRDYERELCASVQEEVMPWDLVDSDLKLIHRTQPVLGTIQYNFDKPKLKKSNPMSGKKTTTSRFGLPREKGRPSTTPTAILGTPSMISRIILSYGIVDAVE